MPLSNLFTIALAFAAAAGLYRFRAPISAAFRRFEARNEARKAEEWRARFDGLAHYRQTVALAEEQFEPVSTIRVPDRRTGTAVTHNLFLGEEYATLKEAEEVRHAAVIGRARDFYRDLDRIYLSRQGPRDRHMRGPGTEADP